jgi:hypothetical protein
MRAPSMPFLLLGQLLASNVWADDFKTVQDYCQNIKAAPKARIESCLALISSGKVSKAYAPQVYYTVAYAWSELHDFERSIEYTRKEIEVASENMKTEIASGKVSDFSREAWPKQMSFMYKMLGQYFALARLSGIDTKSDKALKYAKAELASYDAAIAYNHENDKAYIARAEVHSLLCEESQASADQQAAMRIARGRDDDAAYNQYRFEALPGCVTAWKPK